MNPPDNETCPCGSGLDFATCCAPYLTALKPAPTASALMRSRYTAYARRDAAYLLKTWHSSTRPRQLDLKGDTTQWLSLVILDTTDMADSDQAEVEFTARFVQNGQPQTLHERSLFVREQGCWYYQDGHAQWTRDPKPGRNDPCPCGSGKKYKKCCAN